MELMESSVTAEAKGSFRMTEMGLIPSDWGLVKLRSQCQVITKGTTPTSIGRGFKTSGINFIKAETLTEEGGIVQSKVAFIDEDTNRVLGRSQLQENDVLFSIAGVLGRVGVIKSSLLPANTNQALAIIRLSRSSDIDHGFLLRVLNSASIKKHIEGINVQAAQANLSLENVGDFLLPVPPTIEEQRAIATALSDVDGLLAGLDALIAKKKALKQGAMQQLLTGKQRLPGFKGEWVVRRLGELGSVYGGLTGKSKADFGTGNARYIPFMNIMQGPIIDTGFLEQVRVGAHESQNRAMKGDLFFNGSSETPEEVGMCSVLREDIPNLYLNSFSFGFRLQKDRKTEPMFLSYWFRSPAGRQVIYSSAQGATRYNLAKSNFLRLEVPCPSPEEQTAIAEVLSDMDAELGALEARRAKTALLKQGMMQELLTGRVRLV